MTTIFDEEQDIGVRVAKTFMLRAKAQGLKGKARDRAALEFFLGGAAALMTGADRDRLTALAWVVSVRGYAEIERIVTMRAAHVMKEGRIWN